MSDCVEPLRRVVFHADDFGMNPAVNQGILTTFREGLLTSTSLLANAPAAEAACQQWGALTAEFQSGRLPSSLRRQQITEPEQPFDRGIHLTLTQGSPLTGRHFPDRLLDHQGNFPGVGKLFFQLSRAGATERKLVAAELEAQIEWMCDHGYPPHTSKRASVRGIDSCGFGDDPRFPAALCHSYGSRRGRTGIVPEFVAAGGGYGLVPKSDQMLLRRGISSPNA